MFDNIFAVVANMSITASIVAVIIMGIRLVLRQRLPKLFSYTLWSIVLIRLLIPYSFSTPLSLFNMMPLIASKGITQISGDIRTIEYLPQLDKSPQSVSKESILNYNMQDSISKSAAPGYLDIIRNTMLNVSVLWIVGFILFFGFCIITYFRTIGKLKTATRYHGNNYILGFIQKLSIKKEIEIYTSDMIISPVVCGVVKPRLILPISIVESYDETVMQHIIVHELVHIKRLDYITNAISVLALCMHWFNPFVWISLILSHKDMEMSCDERVLSILGTGTRSSYASSLLNLAVKQNNLLNGGVLAFGESSIKSRIKNIMGYKEPAFWAGLLSVVVLVLSYVVMISNPYVNTSKDIEINLSLVKDGHIENWANYKDIPEYLINSVIAIEDEKFIKHNGVDLIKSSRAFIQTINPSSESAISGGSTITQQLVKNIKGDKDRTLQRKKREMQRAIALEKKYTKEQIIEAYLNTVYLGHQLFGVEDASKYYFGKELRELSLSEFASLAAIIDQPNEYNPIDHPENNRLKRDDIIDKMFNLKMISQEEKQQALSENTEVNNNNAIPQ